MHPGHIRISITDSHPLTLLGLRTELERDPKISVSFITLNISTLQRNWRFDTPDLAIIDMTLCQKLDGLEFARGIVKARDESDWPKVLMYASRATGDQVVEALDVAGVDGFCFKVASGEDLRCVIQKMIDGCGWALCDEAARLYREFRNRPRLDEAECNALRHVAAGMTTKDISKAMYVSTREIERRLHDAQEKLGAKNRPQAVKVAIERELL